MSDSELSLVGAPQETLLAGRISERSCSISESDFSDESSDSEDERISSVSVCCVACLAVATDAFLFAFTKGMALSSTKSTSFAQKKKSWGLDLKPWFDKNWSKISPFPKSHTFQHAGLLDEHQENAHYP